MLLGYLCAAARLRCMHAVRTIHPPTRRLESQKCTRLTKTPALVAMDAVVLRSVKQPVDMGNQVPPAAWLQRLVNDKQLMQPRELSSLMATSREMCEAVLRVMKPRWLSLEVSQPGLRHCQLCICIYLYGMQRSAR